MHGLRRLNTNLCESVMGMGYLLEPSTLQSKNSVRRQLSLPVVILCQGMGEVYRHSDVSKITIYPILVCGNVSLITEVTIFEKVLRIYLLDPENKGSI